MGTRSATSGPPLQERALARLLRPGFGQQNPLKPEEQAAQIINAANKAFAEKQFPVAIDRYREYIKTHANQKDATLARYGLSLCLVEGPQKDYKVAIETLNQVVGVQEFVDRYKKRFQTNPALFAMQGYDAAKLVLDAVRKGASSGEAVHEQFLTQADLSSLAGPAAFGPDGTLNRPLFLVQIKRGRFQQVN